MPPEKYKARDWVETEVKSTFLFGILSGVEDKSLGTNYSQVRKVLVEKKRTKLLLGKKCFCNSFKVFNIKM